MTDRAPHLTAPHNCARVEQRLARLVDALRLSDVDRAYLFGSAARGEADELSDLDVVVIMRTHLPFFERLTAIARTLPGDVGAVDLLAYTPDEFEAMTRDGNAFALMVAEEGRLIYGGPES